MAIFHKKAEEKKGTETASSKKGKETVLREEGALAERVLVRPRITEKAYGLNALGQYVFVVAQGATKDSVKIAVEKVYGVKVTGVRIVRTPKKKRYSGQNRSLSFKKAMKKAIVRLKKGESIELFKAGV